jgi:hypothetical protein
MAIGVRGVIGDHPHSPWIVTSDEAVERWRRAFRRLLRDDEKAVALVGCLGVKFDGPIACAGYASAGILNVGGSL